MAIDFTNERFRAYLYRIALATVPLAVAAGWVDNDVASNILLIVAAVLGVGAPVLATANTTTKQPPQ